MSRQGVAVSIAVGIVLGGCSKPAAKVDPGTAPSASAPPRTVAVAPTAPPSPPETDTTTTTTKNGRKLRLLKGQHTPR